MLKRIDWLLEKITTILVFAVTITVLLQVFYRFVLRSPLMWSEELAKGFYVWFVFLGSAVAVNEGLHIRVDFFTNKLSEALRNRVGQLMDVISIIFFIVLAKEGYSFVQAQSGIISAGLSIPMNIYTAAVPTGSIFIVLNLVRDFINRIRV